MATKKTIKRRPKKVRPEPKESPYSSSCATIAEHFAPLGFKYAKSLRHFTKQTNDLSFRIRFESSDFNVRGKSVALYVYLEIYSKRLKKWRSEQPNALSDDGWITGHQIRNSAGNNRFGEWNLASPDREALIRDVISKIEQLAVPYFSQFEDIEVLVKKLEQGEILIRAIGCGIEFLLSYDLKASAVAHAKSRMRSSSGSHDEWPGNWEMLDRLGLKEIVERELYPTSKA